MLIKEFKSENWISRIGVPVVGFYGLYHMYKSNEFSWGGSIFLLILIYFIIANGENYIKAFDDRFEIGNNLKFWNKKQVFYYCDIDKIELERVYRGIKLHIYDKTDNVLGTEFEMGVTLVGEQLYEFNEILDTHNIEFEFIDHGI